MMRFVIGAGVLCATSGMASGTMLQNGDLELPLDAAHETDTTEAWTLVEPGGVNSATFATFANHTPGGDRGLWLRPWDGGSSQPAPVDATLYQDVAGVEGRKYTLSAWFLFEAHYSGLDPAVPTQTILALDFLDAGHGVIGSAELDLDAIGINDSTWRQYMVMGVSPVGTTFVRARMSMIDGVFEEVNPQSAFVDDFELAPAPGSAALMALLGGAGLRRRRV